MQVLSMALADSSHGGFAFTHAVVRLENYAAVDWGQLTTHDREILAEADAAASWDAAFAEAAKYYDDPEEAVAEMLEGIYDITVRYRGVEFHIESTDAGDVLLVSEPVPDIVAAAFLAKEPDFVATPYHSEEV